MHSHVDIRLMNLQHERATSGAQMDRLNLDFALNVNTSAAA